MVWAVTSPNEFGQFFPCGDYPELEARLAEYYTREMPADEKVDLPTKVDYNSQVFHKFTNEIGRPIPGSDRILPPLSEHEWPREFQAKRRIGTLGSLFQTVNQVLTVDEKLKAVIEGIEPGAHQFRPVVLRQPNGEIVDGLYLTLVIGTFLDSFVPDAETEGELWTWATRRDASKNYVRTGHYLCSADSREDFAGLAFSRAAFGHAHLWREPKLSRSLLFLSDELRDAIKASGLKIPAHFQAKEVA